MEKNKVTTSTEKEMEEFIKLNSDILFKKTSQEVGSRVNETFKEKRKTIDGKFTKVNLIKTCSIW